jgi:hypothetical protein
MRLSSSITIAAGGRRRLPGNSPLHERCTRVTLSIHG